MIPRNVGKDVKTGGVTVVKKKKRTTFGFEFYIFDQSGTRHQLCIYVMLPTSPCNKMTILERKKSDI